MHSEQIIREIKSQFYDDFADVLSEKRLLPQTTLVDAGGLGQFKVRLYPDEEAAKVQERLIHRVGNHVPMPKLIGRDGPFLVFEYLRLGGTPSGDLALLASGIGSILRNLSNFRPETEDNLDLDGEFNSWLKTLQQIGYVSDRAAEAIWHRYLAERPEPPLICLDHWDAMFHNFGQKAQDVYLLDEKHLRYSYACVGLVKPSLLMEKDQFEALLRCFGDSDTIHFYQSHRPFLLLYYLVAALHFYALQQLDGRSRIPANPRLRYYRGNLIRMVWPSPFMRLLEGLRFLLRYPGETIYAFIRRLTGPIDLHKVLRRLFIDFQPWDENAF